MRMLICTLAGSLLPLLASPAVAATTGDGLRLAASDSESWSPWQARLAVVSTPLGSTALHGGPLQLGAARIAGDRYFNVGRIGDGGGLRATSALLLGAPSLALGAPAALSSSIARGPGDGGDLGASTYIGLGYSAWWARSGLGVSADLGLLAQRPGQLFRLGTDSLDGTVRALQLSPVVQLNLSYSF